MTSIEYLSEFYL